MTVRHSFLGALLSVVLATVLIGAAVQSQAMVPTVINGDLPEILAPAAVALEVPVPNTAQLCTGTLWRPRIIITAAHCVTVMAEIDETVKVVDPKGISVWAPGANRNKDHPHRVKVVSLHVPRA